MSQVKTLEKKYTSQKQADSNEKQYYYANVRNLSCARIILKNLIYVIGLSESIADETKLRGNNYFGQFGPIKKLVVNKKKAYNTKGSSGPSYSAYITFEHEQDASLTVLCLDGTVVENHLLKASFGTTKYLIN